METMENSVKLASLQAKIQTWNTLNVKWECQLLELQHSAE